MLARLLESKKEGERPGWGALVSTIAHTVAIGAAVFATAQARVDERATVEVLRWVMPPIARPVTAPAPAIPSRRSGERPALAATSAPLVIDRIDVVIPPVDLTARTTSPDPGPLVGGIVTPGPKAVPTSGVASTEPFSADQVERQVYLRPGSPPPRYYSLFEAAVRDALASMRFGAAEVGGKKVRQLVQMPFVFTLSR